MSTDQNEEWLSTFEKLVASLGREGAHRRVCKLAGDEVARRVLKAYEKKLGIIKSAPHPTTLQLGHIEEWYTGPSDDDDRFWPALRRFLINEKGWNEASVSALDSQSTSVMRLLPPPGGRVDAKGLVVGYVQSGKTANYTALISKAADVGYRLFIVLAGIHNGLRRQTQQRLQAELVDSDQELKSQWHLLTHPTEDFRASGTNPDAFLGVQSGQRVLLVVKKNAHVLARLVRWLNRAQIRVRELCPALIIDDEADQAGLNTGTEDKRSAINLRILELKRALPKSAYVGYTATPFANVLTDASGEDLYPSDFIVSLPKPDGYFGTELFFGRDELEDEEGTPPQPPDMFRTVEEHEVALVRPMGSEDMDSFTPQMAPSLRRAIHYFLLATGARWVRGHRKKHSSMLVHTALNTQVHDGLMLCVRNEVEAFRKQLKNRNFIVQLKAHWEDEHRRVRPEDVEAVDFDVLQPLLEDVVNRTKVVMDNGQSLDRLVYKEEHHLTDEDAVAHIAVGGNTLSRGLTLEGLIVSYFVRSSSTYDTLLQMGRWFGYRRGYHDLPRLWMTDELRSAFHSLATVEEEVRRDIARYEQEGLTPRQFAVRIRTHPTLAITSRLKMRHAVRASVNYAGLTRQTTKFYTDDESLLGNWRAGGQLLDEMNTSLAGGRTASKGVTAFTGVAQENVRKFIASYRFHEDNADLAPGLLVKYLDAQKRRGVFDKWTVAVVTREVPIPALGTAVLGSSTTVNLISRSRKDGGSMKSGVTLGTMTTQANFEIGLDDSFKGREDRTRRQISRPQGSEPLLLLYPISKDSMPGASQQTDSRTFAIGANHHLLGVAFAFPANSRSDAATDGVEYVSADLGLREPEYMEEDVVIPEEDDG